MSTIASGGRNRRSALFIAGAASAAVILTSSFFALAFTGPAVSAGGFEAVHQVQGVAPVPAASGYADLVARVAPSIVTVRSERMVRPAALLFGEGEDQLPPFLRRHVLEDRLRPMQRVSERLARPGLLQGGAAVARRLRMDP